MPPLFQVGQTFLSVPQVIGLADLTRERRENKRQAGMPVLLFSVVNPGVILHDYVAVVLMQFKEDLQSIEHLAKVRLARRGNV